MVWTDIDGLEYYNSNPVFGCYGEPVFEPNDITLQASGLPDITSGMVFAINICDTAGNFIENANDYFEWFTSSFVISGVTYYFMNLRCINYSPAMIANKCFTVQLVIVVESFTVFSKFTQRYDLMQSEIFPSGVFMTDTILSRELEDCVPAPTTDVTCGRPYIKITSTFDCVDAFSGDYYQTGTIISGTASFAFTRFCWIEGRIRQVPRDTKRTISINCRTQRTETTKQYLVLGDKYGGFPIWKVDEIEGMLTGNHLYVNGTEYQSEGGIIFEQFGEPKGCQYRYKLNMKLQSCKQWQIFGCVPNCDDLATFYPLSRPYEAIYDDNQRLVATDNTELLAYFGSLEGYKSAEVLPFNLPCPSYALFKVQSTGVLPKFIYLDEVIPSSKVYPQSLPANTLDFTPLCNGITNNNQVPSPEIGVITTEQWAVPVPDVAVITTGDAQQYVLSVTPESGWTLNPNYSSGVDYFGEVTLNISLSSTTITPPYMATAIATVSQEGIPNNTVIIYGTDNANLPDDAIVTINDVGQIRWTGNETNQIGGTYYVEFFMVKYNKNN